MIRKEKKFSNIINIQEKTNYLWKMYRTSKRKTHKRILWTFLSIKSLFKPVIYPSCNLFSLFVVLLVVVHKTTTNQYLFANAASLEPRNALEEASAVPSRPFHLNVTTIKVLTSEKYLEIRGHGFDLPNLRDISFYVATESNKCNESEKALKILSKSESSILLLLSENFAKGETMYLCYQETINTPLIHLGADHKFIR